MIKIKDKISFGEQTALLNRCIDNGVDLSIELKDRGLTYDHLRYKEYPGETIKTTGCRTIEDVRTAPKNIPAISFFSGAGGLDIGFEYAGFTNLASIEINELFCDTLRANFPDHTVIGPPYHNGDVRNREVIADLLRTKLNIGTQFEGVFHGGPPCQSFSIAANQRFAKGDENFKRTGFYDAEKGSLLNDYIWFIEEFRPKVFMIENVPGLYEIDGGAGLNRALERLARIGYNIATPQVVNASYYGVPQKRLRLMVVGAREKEKFEFPEIDPHATPCLGTFENPVETAANHITREHTAQSILRYMQLGYGKRDHLGRVDRLNPYLPSKTVIAGGTKGGGRSHLHPFSPRTISVRECARLQTFPDNYVFTGSPARQFTQVGNAVPPLLGYRIANQILNRYYK